MGWFDGIRDKLNNELAKMAKDRDFMEGAMAASAWMAAADGSVGEKEKQKVNGFIQRSEYLKHFDRVECGRKFQEYVGDFEFDFGMATDRMRKELGEIKGDDKKVNIARLALAVAASSMEEGETQSVSDQEKVVGREICQAMGLDPKSVGL